MSIHLTLTLEPEVVTAFPSPWSYCQKALQWMLNVYFIGWFIVQMLTLDQNGYLPFLPSWYLTCGFVLRAVEMYSECALCGQFIHITVSKQKNLSLIYVRHTIKYAKHIVAQENELNNCQGGCRRSAWLEEWLWTWERVHFLRGKSPSDVRILMEAGRCIALLLEHTFP